MKNSKRKLGEREISRRAFIGGMSSGIFLSSCASLDRWALKEDAQNPNRVCIVGGGLAGLTTALQLKKAGVPFRVFEANARAGGRVYTLRDANAASQSVELGAAFFSPHQEALMSLLKELKLKSEPSGVSGLPRVAPFASPSFVREVTKSQKNAFKILQKEKPEQLDSLSLAEFGQHFRASLTPEWLFWSERACQMIWGIEKENLSLLAWFERMKTWKPDPVAGIWSPWTENNLRVEGGSQNLVQSLLERISGIIPEQTYRARQRLIEITQEAIGFRLSFETSKGIEHYTTNKVVFALPFSVLSEIAGIDKIGLSGEQVHAIKKWKMGTQSKVLIGLQERFWKTRNDSESWHLMGPHLQQLHFEAPRDPHSPATLGVVSVVLSGTAGLQSGPSQIPQLQKELALGFGAKDFIWDKFSRVQNWSRMPFAKGSVGYLSPGQASQFPKLFDPQESVNGIYFAGEHLATSFPGTMNGAVESGLQVAKQLV
jgi:monoamine oxidase